MDSNQFLKFKEQIRNGYKKQLQDIVLQGCVFFNVYEVEEWVHEATYAATPPVPEEEL